MAELRSLVDLGVLEPLDAHFARALARLSGSSDPLLCLGAALASRLSQDGQVCAELSRFAGIFIEAKEGQALPQALPGALSEGRWPPLGPWLDALGRAQAVGRPSDPIPGVSPLVLDYSGRLYLRRLYEDQVLLARSLLARASAPLNPVDGPLLGEGLDRLFGPGSREADHPANGLRRATLVCLLRPLAVITGGPGTGKTTTVASLLALLVEQALASGAPLPKARLLAPTGKAAARLLEALGEARGRLPISEEVRAALPDEASTIHRALGPLGPLAFQGGLGARFRHGPGNPLPADLVVVDEASMVDLSLMARLVEALGPSTRLLLLGDPHQLASVEAGTLLGDLAGPCSSRAPFYSAPLLEAVGDLEGAPLLAEPGASELGLVDSLAPLTHSFRFGARSGIGRLARAIEEGDADRALALLGDEALPDVCLVEPKGQWAEALAMGAQGRGPWHGLDLGPLMALMREGYADFLAAQGPEERLLALGRFRVLCAHRQGPLGSEALSAAFEAPLREDGRPCTGPHYDGRPLIVTENHYALELWNGDLGVVSAALDPGVQPDGRPGPARPSPPSLRAFFPTSSGVLRSLAPARLPAHEPLFAMSVHKSQGSEFDEVLVVLPDRVTRVLSRELLYTAVTRARRRVSIYSGREVLASALGRRVERASGFGELLWGPGVTDA